MTDWAAEREDVLSRFAEELSKATGDGSKKRQAGEKPPWYDDPSHIGSIFSHFTKWFRGELEDADSGAHPLVHAAWRCLAIACIETGNIPEEAWGRDLLSSAVRQLPEERWDDLPEKDADALNRALEEARGGEVTDEESLGRIQRARERAHLQARVEELEVALRAIVRIGENRRAEGHTPGGAHLIARAALATEETRGEE